MFYTYALPFDTGGSAVYSKAVGAATVQTPFAIARTAPQPVVVGTLTSQTIGYPPPAAATDPFSSDFSTDFGPTGSSSIFSREFSREFGNGPGVGGHSLLTVNKVLGFGDLMALTLTLQNPFNIPLPTSQSQAATKSYTHFATWLASVTSAMSVLLTFPRLNHSIVAAVSASSARLRRSYAFWLRVNTPSNLFTDEFTDEWGVGFGGHKESLSLSIGQILTRSITAPWIGAQTLAMVKRVSRLSRLLNASTAVIFRQPSQFDRATSAAVQSRVLTTSHRLAAVIGNTARVIRLLPKHCDAASTQLAHLILGGSFHIVMVNAISAQALGLLRQLAALYGAITDNRGAVIRSTLKSFVVASGSVGFVVRTVSLARSAVTLGLTLVTRTIGIPRRVASGSVAVLSPLAAHVSPVIQAISSSVANLAKVLAHGTSLTLPTAHVMTSRLAVMSGRLREFGTAQSQDNHLIRGIGLALTAAFQIVASVAKMIAWSASVASASAVTALQIASHSMRISVATGVALATMRVSRIVLGAALALVNNVSTGFGRFAHVFPAAFSTNVAGIVRLTNKLITAATSLIVRHIRGVVAITLHVELVQVSYGQASRNVYLIAAQTQRSRTVRWFHLFVPQWAYQQTTLLPPDGGPAEPPSFGPIDPADQTTFAFDWAVRSNINDPIVSAAVTSTPTGMTLLGPVFVSGSLVEVTIMPFTPHHIPMTYRLRCTAVFASGRRSSFTIPVPVRTL